MKIRPPVILQCYRFSVAGKVMHSNVQKAYSTALAGSVLLHTAQVGGGVDAELADVKLSLLSTGE